MVSSSTSPKLPESALDAKLRRCTEVIQYIEGQALDICTAGRTAALHIATKEGRIVIRLPRAEVAQKCLAGVDANGRPLATTTSVMETLMADAEATAPKMDEASPRPRAVAQKPKRLSHAEATAAYERVWAELDGGSLEPVKEIAARHGVLPAGVYFWVNHHHAKRWELLLKRRRGKASQAELAALGFPLTKPSSASL